MYQGVVVVVVVVMVVGRYVGCREWLDMGEGGVLEIFQKKVLTGG